MTGERGGGGLSGRLVLSNIRSKVVAVLITINVTVKIAMCIVFKSNSQNDVCDLRFYAAEETEKMQMFTCQGSLMCSSQ